jgi:undecaprenyl-diphosphatase
MNVSIFEDMVFLLESGIWHKLQEFDQWLFLQINGNLTNPVFDVIMPFMRTAKHWVPLYLFLIVFGLLNFRFKGAWWVVFMLSTVAMTDMTGTYAFKKVFERPRPCNDLDLFTKVRLLVDHCSGGFSFVSNHAANHFALATFFFITMRPLMGKWAAIGLVWAAVISYAQVYVGVHYPADILAGSLLGLIFGTFTGRLFNKRYGIITFDNQPT